MYSTCLFCSGALGCNEAIEHFPVGRRLAFDAAKGRLWVVCKACARWNLTPLESRWEAIEEAERAYRDTKLRASTPNVGLAKLKDGTELVRIGSPMLPEFAAWRYGEIFRRRQLKSNWFSAGTTALTLGHSVGSIGASNSWFGASSMAVSVVLSSAMFASFGAQLFEKFKVRARVRNSSGQLLRISLSNAQSSQVIAVPTSESWMLRLHHRRLKPGGRVYHSFMRGSLNDWDPGWTDLEGASATRALAQILPSVNSHGGSRELIQQAVDLTVNDVGLREQSGGGAPSVAVSPLLREGSTPVGRLSPVYRLALEMTLHEADERRAMEGELAELEARWKEAEEIAAIADNMFLPADVIDRVERLKEH